MWWTMTMERSQSGDFALNALVACSAAYRYQDYGSHQ